jgi:hypothetical protein
MGYGCRGIGIGIGIGIYMRLYGLRSSAKSRIKTRPDRHMIWKPAKSSGIKSFHLSASILSLIKSCSYFIAYYIIDIVRFDLIWRGETPYLSLSDCCDCSTERLVDPLHSLIPLTRKRNGRAYRAMPVSEVSSSLVH